MNNKIQIKTRTANTRPAENDEIRLTDMPELKNCMQSQQAESCSITCALNLSLLFDSPRQRKDFDSRWKEFLQSDSNHPRIYKMRGDLLEYHSEQLIPEKADGRPSLLLVFGNPASHSVAAGMFFSFEGQGREHRFWKNILKPAGVLDLPVADGVSIEALNAERRKKMFCLDYESPFRVGLCVLISLPSAPGGRWGGIAGIQKLFGPKAFALIEEWEQKRVVKTVHEFVTPDGAVVTFQKNAWNALRSPHDPTYHSELAKAGKLVGKLKNNPAVSLYCVPPTRLAGPCRNVLRDLLAGRQ